MRDSRLGRACLVTLVFWAVIGCADSQPDSLTPAAGDVTTVTEPSTVATRAAPEDGAAVDVAKELMVALAAYDADHAASLLAPEALAMRFGSVEGLRRELEFNKSQGYEWVYWQCDANDGSESGTPVSCVFNYHAIVSAEFLERSFYGSSLDLVVRDGRVVALEENLEQSENGFESEILEPFKSWVAENHPDDVGIMFGDPMVLQSAESVTLWEQRRSQYREALIAEAENYEARATEICTTALATLNREVEAAGVDLGPGLPDDPLMRLPTEEVPVFGTVGDDWNVYFRNARSVLRQALRDVREVQLPLPIRDNYEAVFEIIEGGGPQLGMILIVPEIPNPDEAAPALSRCIFPAHHLR